MIFICNWLREIAVTNEKTKKQQGKNFQNCPPLEETLFFFGSDESLAAGLKREMTWSGLSAAQVAQKAKVKESDIQRVTSTLARLLVFMVCTLAV